MNPRMTKWALVLGLAWCGGAHATDTMTGFGSALRFDGNDDRVLLGNPSSLGLTNFTLECWFSKTGAGAATTTGAGGITAVPLVTKGRAQSDGSNVDMNYFLGITDGGALGGDFEDMAGGLNHPITGTTVIADTNWHHAAFTCDGANLRLYLDGSADAAPVATAATPRYDSILSAAIATAFNSSAPDGFFQGAIDDVRIWNIALPAATIADWMDREVDVTHPDYANLAAYYKLNEGAGTAAGDSAGSNDGTLENGPVWLLPNTLPHYNGGLQDQRGRPGELFSYQFGTNVFTDADGDTLAYEAKREDGSAIPTWIQFDAPNREFSGTTDTTIQSYTLKVIASDGRGGSATGYFSWTVAANARPSYNGGIQDETFATNTAFATDSFNEDTFTDLDGDPLTFTAKLADGDPLPGWLVFSASNRNFSGTTPPAIGSWSIRVYATDPYDESASGMFYFHVVETIPNHAPVYHDTFADQTYETGTAFSYPLPAESFTDEDGDTLTFSGSQMDGYPLPGWIHVDPTNGTVYGTTPDDETAVYMKVIADDGQGGSAYGSLTLNVERPAPVVWIRTMPGMVYGVDTYSVEGVADGMAGAMRWTNTAASAAGSLAAGSPWQIDVPLATGENEVAVSGTNTDGTVVSDRVVFWRYPAAPPACYVWTNSPSPTWPYTNWSTAAHTIQDAVDAAQSGATVWVTNGVYDTGGGVIPGYACTNRVVVTNAIHLRSVNGPEPTVIGGGNAVRGVYLGAGILDGFTVTHGQTLTSGDTIHDRNGGGVNMCGGNGVVFSCRLTGNSADGAGGCYDGTLYNCRIDGNHATGSGGGCEASTLHNCLIVDNDDPQHGGGCYGGTLHNCTLSGNSATDAGGCYGSTLYNCIVYGNTGHSSNDETSSAILSNCRTADPLFTGGGDYRPRPNSPCIDAGANLHVKGDTDLDGNPRIVNGAVDMGAYENQSPTAVVLYGFDVGVVNGRVVVRWQTASESDTVGFRLYRWGVESGTWDEFGDFVPAHGDGVGATYEVVDADAVPGGTYTYKLVEVLADGGMDEYGPFERLAYVLKITSPFSIDGSNVIIRWLSRSNEFYRIMRTSDLRLPVSGLSALATNIPATPPENVHTDAVEGVGPVFYRIEVERP